MSITAGQCRLAVDIGGTFTDFALDMAGRQFSHKRLTTPAAPEQAVLAGTTALLRQAGLAPDALDLVIHGTTLATNAIIERRGAPTALLATEGFRDSIEMAYENRFEQYDILMDRPPPLVPRDLRFGVPERIDARGQVVVPLDVAAVAALVPVLRACKIASVAIGFLHSYANATHEQQAGAILAQLAPEICVTLSSAVCPEMREYERWSTACANAYVQPVMDGYLGRLQDGLRNLGCAAPLYLITSAGGLATVDLARRFPIRLVESGPAGGAILAAGIAGQCGINHILSFDMGGTTAKICLIDGDTPPFSRSFEVARQYRFLKGSGLPIRIPVIEMVEIGAGGGSVVRMDKLGRVQVGPDSAGSEPGPACYGKGGLAATVTDADLLLGRIQKAHFAGGRMTLDTAKASAALSHAVGAALPDPVSGAMGVVEVVEENMANAARVHATERGRDLESRAMIAFGGAAPLHAARLAQKLDIDMVLIPAGAGVGSAIGFLMAPVSFEIVRSQPALLDHGFDPAAITALRQDMLRDAQVVITPAAPGAALVAQWSADMRYRGQGHELSVRLPDAPPGPDAAAMYAALFATEYAAQFGRIIPQLAVEVMNWSLRLAVPQAKLPKCPPAPAEFVARPAGFGDLANPATGARDQVPLYDRAALAPGAMLRGPALIIEDETTTLVPAAFTARINGSGHIVMTRRGAA